MPVNKNQHSKEELVKMSTKLVPAICTQCSGEMTVDPSLEKAYCQYCGTSFLVEKAINNYNVQHANIERVESINIHNNKRGAVESVLNFIENQQNKKQQKEEEEKRKLEEEKRKQEEQLREIKNQIFNKKYRKRNLIIIGAVAIFIFIISMMGANREKPSHDGEAKTPGGSSYHQGRDFQDVVSDFEDNGFTNIKIEKLEDLITGWLTKDGEVESVSVDGDVDYSPDDWYPNDVEIIITYHTFPENEVDDITEDENSEDTEEVANVDNSITEGNNQNDNADSNTPAPTPTFQPTPTLQPTPSQEVLTIENNEDMATLFKVGDFDPFINEFAEKYSGRIIQFDGYIAHMMPHGDYETRFDLLIYTGNYGESSGNALNFKFEDVNIVSDLKLTGSSIPEYISEGQNLRITAEVEEYKEISGLFFLKPVSTEIRP